MGLYVTSGALASFKEIDEEAFEHYTSVFKNINKLLELDGITPYKEPEELESKPLEVGGFPYEYIHHLRRFYAYCAEYEDWIPTPFSPDAYPSEDSLVEDHTSLLTCHLLCHSDSDGFYVPVKFVDIVFATDDIPVQGTIIGSSYSLLNELKYIANKLNIQLDEEGKIVNINEVNKSINEENDFWREKLVWCKLFEVANHSIRNKAAIIFH
ncbi:hypothetical protein Q4517_05640 [Tenacibaculum sp. 1_MG-2023]|uniref:hypothetical protein n=1 Tax=Tenacibaculum sp. 1_MG-2023 TaxID=3062653 RepID=UPI0026E37C5D|nr:hypothetical protein [Tenacibaculum sp. 1_MG-2023]MDO6675026.1 hypothetical protein [Tenacibaculum sp. 1_MG-2023]